MIIDRARRGWLKRAAHILAKKLGLLTALGPPRP